MNLAAMLHAHALERGAAPALIVESSRGPRQLTFAELDAASAHAAGLLHRQGLRAGDTVLLFVPMSLDLYVALAAIFRLGLVAMFVDPAAGWRRLDACCALRPPRALIATPPAHLLRLVSRQLGAIPLKFVAGACPLPGALPWRWSARGAPHRETAAVGGEHPALVTFTSGSTGEPKAIVRTHGFLREQHRVLQKCLRSQPGDVELATMPVVLLSNLAAGVTSLIPHVDLSRPGNIDPARLARCLFDHGVTTAVGSPALFERLAAYCGPRGLSFPRLRRLATGGAPVFPRLLAQLQGLAPEAETLAVYGSSEAEPIASMTSRAMTPEDVGRIQTGQGLLAGRPVDDIELRIVPDQGGAPLGPFGAAEFAAVCLPRAQRGEIVVRGPHVLSGCAESGDGPTSFRVESTSWHRTGDAGLVDAQGRLWLQGRCAARIDDAEGVVYPLTVEAPFYDDPDVRRAALVARSGRRIVLLEYADRRRRVAAQAASLAPLVGVAEVRACRGLPVDARHNAKIDYPRLRRLLDQGRI